jgi:hypothetical protein
MGHILCGQNEVGRQNVTRRRGRRVDSLGGGLPFIHKREEEVLEISVNYIHAQTGKKTGTVFVIVVHHEENPRLDALGAEPCNSLDKIFEMPVA